MSSSDSQCRLTSKLFLRSESCLLLVSALLTPCPLSLRPWHALQKEINKKQKYQSRWWGYNDTIENINDQIKNKKHMRYSTWFFSLVPNFLRHILNQRQFLRSVIERFIMQHPFLPILLQSHPHEIYARFHDNTHTGSSRAFRLISWSG